MFHDTLFYSIGGNSNQGLLSSDISVGGLKIGYEKQVDSINTEEDMELELEPSPSAIVEEPMTRSRYVIFIFLYIVLLYKSN